MSRSSVTHGVLFHIHKHVGRSGKMTFELSAQRLIQSGQHARGITRVRGWAASAAFSMDAISAAGKPCPETSATRIPRCFSSTTMKS